MSPNQRPSCLLLSAGPPHSCCSCGRRPQGGEGKGAEEEEATGMPREEREGEGGGKGAEGAEGRSSVSKTRAPASFSAEIWGDMGRYGEMWGDVPPRGSQQGEKKQEPRMRRQ